jgi:hypothetical protein
LIKPLLIQNDILMCGQTDGWSGTIRYLKLIKITNCWIVSWNIFSINHSFIHSFINGSTALLLGPGLLFSFIIFFFFTQTVGLLGRVITPSQGLYLHTGQHKHRINAHTQTSMRRVGFEPMIPASERAKTVRALDRSATVIGLVENTLTF